MDDVLQSLAQAMAKKRQEAGQTDMTQDDVDAGNQAINAYDMTKSGSQLGEDLLAAGKDNKDNYDVYGMPKSDKPMDFAPSDAPMNDPTLAANGPNLFDRVSGAMQKQQAAGNVGAEAPAPIAKGGKSGGRSPAEAGGLTVGADTAPVVNKDGAYGADLNDAAIAAAQKQANYNRMVGNLVNAGDRIASGFSKGASKYSGSGDAIINEADQGVKDISVRRDAKDKDVAHQNEILKLATEKDKTDPNSDVSKLYREVLTKMGVQVSEKGTAASIEKAFPAVEKYFVAQDQIAGRQALREATASSKAEERANKASVAMGQDLDPNRARSGELGKNQARVNAAGRLDALFQSSPDGNLDSRQIHELSLGLAGLLSGGTSPALASTMALVPHTASGKMANIEEWLTGNPTGANQQKFVQRMMETVKREKETAQNQIVDAQMQKARTTHHRFEQSNPDDFYANLANATGLDIDEAKARYNAKSGAKASKASGPSPQSESGSDPRIDQFMEHNNITDRDQAIKILKDAGKI